MRLRLLILVPALSLVMVVGLERPASAACHAFTVSVDRAEVVESESVTVTVERDFNAAPSSIDVFTVDETALAGTDYEPLAETADFPDGGTDQTFTVATTARDGAQGSRTFRVELDNPQGCDVNTNYDIGGPATVTVVDAAEESTTSSPDSQSDESTTTADNSTTTAGDANSDVTQEAAPDDDSRLPDTGRPSALIPAAIAIVAVLVAAVLLRRTRA